MALMHPPVLDILLGQCFIADHQQILCIFLLGRSGEVERAGDYRLIVDDDDFIVGNLMDWIDLGRDPGFGEKGAGGVLGGQVALVQRICTLTPLWWAGTRVFAIGADVKEKACIRMDLCAWSSSLTMAAVAPPFGEK